MLYEYAIAPLAAYEWAQRADAIVQDVKRGAYTMPLFSMAFVPEGDPVWDKAEDLVALYAQYRRRLDKAGVACGILVQASLGHGYPLTAAPALFAEAHILEDLSDSGVTALFDGSVFLDGVAAKGLSDRGFDRLLGVSVSAWDGGKISAESFDDAGYICCTKQKSFHKLTPAPTTQTLSRNIRREAGRAVQLSPAVTVLPRENGKLTAVFCGSPQADFVYTEGFSFLNETRKAQFVSLLTRAGALPVYLTGDDEVCLRAGDLSDGSLLVACFPLGFDPLVQPRFYFQTPPVQISLLSADGTAQPVAFSAAADNMYTLDCRIEPMTPAVFVISQGDTNSKTLF